ncbi:MAG: hypothetical protein HYS39_01010 [Proteobacteria bacterium]|nr:hypothetical protein [Pseudomonadota bacterium]
MKRIFSIIILLSTFHLDVVNASQPIYLPSPSPQALASWQKFHRFTGKDLASFISQHLIPITQDISTVFYPFGGPDVLYPLSLYPKATNVILVGLEFPGQEFMTLDPASSFIQTKSLLRRSFFITSQMSKQFSKKTGVIPPILLQLKLLGVKEVTLFPFNKPYRGVKVSFQHNQLAKNIIYYRVNLQDNRNPSPFLKDIVDQYPDFACLLKASSYIPHQQGFRKIRDFIVNQSKVIIQDDSGIPLKKLKELFDINTFGRYIKPYGIEFKNYFQQDLADLTQKNKSLLPFCFGYGCRAPHQPSSLILAVKSENH